MTGRSPVGVPAIRVAGVRARPEIALFAAGALGVVVSGLIARSGTVGTLERAVFRVINGLPGWLYPVMWPLQQVGNLAAGPAVALAAAMCHRGRLALAALLVTLIDVEGYVKHLVPRERPGAIVPGAILRGDVSAHGHSFPSGHAILITSLAVIVTPYLRGRWRWGPWLAVAGVAVGRIYVGAHNPLDLVAGIGLGLMIGVLAYVAVLRPRPSPDPQTESPTMTVRRSVSGEAATPGVRAARAASHGPPCAPASRMPWPTT
jgi:membrane-associated phospholipid phosphatase